LRRHQSADERSAAKNHRTQGCRNNRGEHQGFLAFIGADRKEQALVDAENNDRQLVYDAIAKQQGTAAEVVGRRRALQIADNAKPGEWIQDAGGKWVQK
jgi:uncharacterized protein YdbL (DUF1318 family)